MGSYNSVTETNPYGVNAEVLKINSDGESYALRDVIGRPGDYTFSVWHKGEGMTVNLFGFYGYMPPSATWVKFVKTVTVSDITNDSIYILPDSNADAFLFEAYCAEGTVDTSWSPNPEDQKDIDKKIVSDASADATTKANQAEANAVATASADATAKANQAEAKAKKVATNFLSADSAGIMVYDGELGQQKPSSPSANTSNVLIDSNGMYVRNGSTNLASFTGSSAQIGQNSAAHSVVDTNGMRVYASDGTTQIANLGYGEANAEGGTIIAPYYTFGTRKAGRFNSYNSSYTYEKGDYCEYGGVKFVCVTKISTPESWNPDHWEKIIGASSSALGQEIIASGWGTTAEGLATVACGHGSHAEGQLTVAASCSHAEGIQSKARGTSSHAQNIGTIADGDHQTAIGQYNIADTTSALIIGNGSPSSRSNALTVDWNGNVNIASGARYKINGTDLSASDVGAPSIGDTSWSHIDSSTDFRYIKRSGLVFVDFYKASQTLSTNWTTIGTLPSGYRPAHTIYGSAMSLTTTAIAYYINSSGTIAMRTASGSGNYATGFNTSFPVL